MEHQYIFYSKNGDSFNESWCDFAITKTGTLIYKDDTIYRILSISIIENGLSIDCYPINDETQDDYDHNEKPIEEIDPNFEDPINYN